jgi:transposase
MGGKTKLSFFRTDTRSSHYSHYHRPLQQYLQELDLPVYVIHVQSRPAGMLKTDKRDALMLANTLYNQLELGVQVPNKLQLVRRLMPPTKAAAQLKGLIRHRYELVRESTQRKNKLTAICDELFPELVRVVKARCPFDERTQSYTGKTRVIGRVAGQMIEAIYALLKRDAELLSHVSQGQEPPPPLLYDPEVHQRHRQGQYRPLKSTPPPNVITIAHFSSPE